MKRGEKATEEQIEEAKRLRGEEGLSFGEIAKRVNMSKASVIGYTRGIRVPGEEEVEPEANVGEPFQLMPGKDKVAPSQTVADATNKVRLMRLQLEEKQYQQKLDLIAEEAALRDEERRAALDERRLRLATGGLPPGGDGEQAKALTEELEKAQQTRIELEQKKAELAEQKRQMEIDNLSQKIDALSQQLNGKPQLGASEFDVILSGLEKLNSQLDGGRKDLITLIQSPQIAARFNPQRMSIEARTKAGDVVAQRMEAVGKEAPVASQLKEVRCPSCLATQNIDLAAITLEALKQGASAGSAVSIKCQACQFNMDVSSLLKLPQPPSGEEPKGEANPPVIQKGM